MKKKVFALIVLTVFIMAYSCFAAGCRNGYEKAHAQRYVEYRDQNGKMYFRTADGCTGVGYLTLNGKKVEATYMINGVARPVISVSIYNEEYSCDVLPTSDLNEQNQLVSSKEVVLFGENFGQIVLTLNQLDKKDFEVWEMAWDVQMLDDWKLFSLGVGFRSHELDGKCVVMTAYRDMYSMKADIREYFLFKWLPNARGFEIYKKEENQFVPTEGQQPMATGPYVLQDGKVALTFVADSVFNGAFTTLQLTHDAN